MTETAPRSIEDLLQWAFPKGLVPLDVAERMDHIKALGQAFLLSLRTKTESARLTEFIVQRRDAGLNFVAIAEEIRTTWGIDISNDSCRDRYKRSKRSQTKIVPEQPETAPIETRIEDHNGEPTEKVPQAGPSEEPDTKQLQSSQVNPWDPGMGEGPLPESTKAEILKQVDDPEKKAAFMEQARIDTRIITLHQQARMNPDEIAEKLQLPVSQVQARIDAIIGRCKK